MDVLNKHLFLTAKPMIYLLNMAKKDYIKKKSKWLMPIKKKVNTISMTHFDESLFTYLVDDSLVFLDWWSRSRSNCYSLFCSIRVGLFGCWWRYTKENDWRSSISTRKNHHQWLQRTWSWIFFHCWTWWSQSKWNHFRKFWSILIRLNSGKFQNFCFESRLAIFREHHNNDN